MACRPLALPIPLRTDSQALIEALFGESQEVSDEPLRSLAQQLIDASVSDSEPNVRDLPSISLRQGLEVQLKVLQHRIDRGAQLGGWKVGLSSGASRNLFGVGFRPFGYVLADRILESGATIDTRTMRNCRLEPELCLVLGSDLRGPCSPAEARASVGAVCAAFEVNELRVPRDAPAPVLAADVMGNWGIVAGTQVETTIEDLTMTRVVLERDGVPVGDITPGAEMDDPYVSLSRLASELEVFGRHLHRGDRVITGSFLGAPIESSGRWRAVFDEIGAVEVTFE